VVEKEQRGKKKEALDGVATGQLARQVKRNQASFSFSGRFRPPS
jgi:hypothetical protein